MDKKTENKYNLGLATPAFIFDLDEVKKRLGIIKKSFVNIPISFSIKANPFLVPYIYEEVDYLEVCSPGELQICIKHKVPGEKIIYSGVNKGLADITQAIDYKVAIVTIESLLHFEYVKQASDGLGCTQDVILRLSSGNQFGMSESDIFEIISKRHEATNICIKGLHYFSGTQKGIKAINKDIDALKDFLDKLEKEYGYRPEFLELGTGLKTEYYNEDCDEIDKEMLDAAGSIVNDFAKSIPIGLEFGRFIAASCGTYITSVCDIKENPGGNYVICDGGINQLVYYGQNMAMKVPPIEVLGKSNDTDLKEYCLCGSLCTVADVLVRKAELPELEIGDKLVFGRCGAYSVTEGTALFLSRQLPAVYVYSEENGLFKLRDITDTYDINS